MPNAADDTPAADPNAHGAAPLAGQPYDTPGQYPLPAPGQDIPGEDSEKSVNEE